MANTIDRWLQLEPEDWLVKDCYKELTENEKRTRFELIEKLMIVLPERTPTDFDELRELLQSEWLEIIDSLKVNLENKYAYENIDEAFDNWDIWIESDEEIKSLHINIDRWIDQVRDIFSTNVKLFYSQLATDEDYKKHFSNPNWSEQKIVYESSKRALLLPLVELSMLDQIFVTLAEFFHEAIYHKMCFVFIVETDQIFGYSGGVACRHLLFKIDPGQPIYHVYPIRDNELNNNRKVWTVMEDGEPVEYRNDMSIA